MCFLASITYNAVDKATRFVASINPHLALEMVDIVPPYTLDEIFKAFKAGLKKIQSSCDYIALSKQGERPKIVVIVDALSSNPGILMPWVLEILSRVTATRTHGHPATRSHD